MIVKPQTEEDKKAHDFTVPAGRYAIAPIEFSMKQAKNKDTRYVRFKFEIIGPRKFAKKTFYDSMSLDLTKQGSVFRWQLLMEAFGIDEPVIGSPPEMSWKDCEKGIAKHFMFRGFIADISRSDDGKYVNNGVSKIFPPGKWSEAETKAIRSWEEEQRVKLVDDEGPAFDDDDIPFGNDPEEQLEGQTVEDDDPEW